MFGAEYDDIEIVIHPQSIIHSMVETQVNPPFLLRTLLSVRYPNYSRAVSYIFGFPIQDSSVLAQLGWPDMRLPILYTLSWPERVYCSEITWPRLDLCK